VKVASMDVSMDKGCAWGNSAIAYLVSRALIVRSC